MRLFEVLDEQHGMIYRTSPKVVYHGSLKEFDEVDFSYIGNETGMEKLKGGWGMYFTESEGVAKQYTPEGNAIIMEFRIAGGEYFNLDGMLSDYDFEHLMENLSYYDESVYEKAESFREEVNEYGADDYELTGKSFYDIMSHDFGSAKELSKFLKFCQFKGNTFIDYTQDVRNFVVFDEQYVKRI